MGKRTSIAKEQGRAFEIEQAAKFKFGWYLHPGKWNVKDGRFRYTEYKSGHAWCERTGAVTLGTARNTKEKRPAEGTCWDAARACYVCQASTHTPATTPAGS